MPRPFDEPPFSSTWASLSFSHPRGCWAFWSWRALSPGVGAPHTRGHYDIEIFLISHGSHMPELTEEPVQIGTGDAQTGLSSDEAGDCYRPRDATTGKPKLHEPLGESPCPVLWKAGKRLHVAADFGVSQAIIGLMFIAVITSLLEFTAGIISATARRANYGMAKKLTAIISIS